MPKPRKHRVVLYIKDSDRAIGIIDRLWAVGELTTEQRVAMVSKIDDKRIEIENKKKEKLEKNNRVFPPVLQKYRHEYEEKEGMSC